MLRDGARAHPPGWLEMINALPANGQMGMAPLTRDVLRKVLVVLSSDGTTGLWCGGANMAETFGYQSFCRGLNSLEPPSFSFDALKGGV